MKVIIFHDENGLDVSEVFQADTEEQLDKAAMETLEAIGDFAWDEKTTKLQKKVENGDFNGMWKILKSMIANGYDCFRLDSVVPYVITEVKVL